MKKRTILIAGGSGLVGSRLTDLLVADGHEVRWLSRSAMAGKVPTFQWDTASGHIDEKAFSDVNVIINLAGAGIADKRWTDKRKNLLIDSRTKTAALLDQYIQNLSPKLDIYINASAIGYYGDQGSNIMIEESGPGEGFLSQCCIAWEEAAHQVKGDFPKAIVRIGIVLSTKGGALEKMLIPLKLRTNTYFGDGNQYMSWIHIDDQCGIFQHLIAHPTSGTFNAAASTPETNKTFVKKVAQGMDIGAILLPAPKFGLRIAMGEMADVVLESTRVSNQKIKDYGYTFKFDKVDEAVADLKRKGI